MDAHTIAGFALLILGPLVMWLFAHGVGMVLKEIESSEEEEPDDALNVAEDTQHFDPY